MAATHFGITLNEIYPQPDFRASRDDQARWTASRTYKIKGQTYDEFQIRQKFIQGTAITAIDSTIDPYWSFLKIKEIDVEDEAGAITNVIAYFSGYNENEDTDEGDGTAIEYEERGVLADRDIMQHPKLKQQLDGPQRRALSQLIEGRASVPPEGAVTENAIWDSMSQEVIAYFTDANSTAWFNEIAQNGTRTYRAPSIEWTMTQTNLDGLDQATVDQLAKISTPSGAPLKPSTGTYNWMLIGLNQTEGEEDRTFSVTWELSEDGGWSTLLYS